MTTLAKKELAKKIEEITLNPKQSVMYKILTQTRYYHVAHVGYGGAQGGGKSYGGATWVTRMCIKHKNVRYAICRKELKEIRRTTHNTLFKVFKDMGLKKDTDFIYYKNEDRIYFPKTNSEIIYVSLEHRPEDPLCLRFGGFELTGCFIDEANECRWDVISKFIDRLGRAGNSVWVPASEMTNKEKLKYPKWDDDPIKKGYVKLLVPIKILYTFNPSQNFVYTKFYLPFKQKKQKSDTRFIPAYATDNFPPGHPHLEWLQNMAPGPEKDRKLYGIFDYTSSEIALGKIEDIEWVISHKIKQPPEALKSLVVDVSYSGANADSTILTLWNGLDCYKAFTCQHEHPEDLIANILRVAAKNKVPIERVVIDGNGNGNEIARSRLLEGCRIFDSRFAAIKYETEGILQQKKKKAQVTSKLVSNFNKLRDQCIWKLFENVADRKVTASFDDEGMKAMLKQELLLYENISEHTDKKLRATPKDDLKANIGGRSPDISDCFIMRMYLEVIEESIDPQVPVEECDFMNYVTEYDPYFA